VALMRDILYVLTTSNPVKDEALLLPDYTRQLIIQGDSKLLSNPDNNLESPCIIVFTIIFIAFKIISWSDQIY
jgi:hypothetical protein